MATAVRLVETVVARDGIEPPAPGSIFGPHVDSGDFTLLTYVQNVRTMEPWASSGTMRAKPDSTFASTASGCPSRFVTLGMGAAGRLLVVVHPKSTSASGVTQKRP